MPTDVIIDPSSGQIYWNDGTGTPQSISLGGNAIDQVTFNGYAASFSPGSSPGAASPLVRINDSALGTLVPGTTGNELGSATLRWAFYGTSSSFSTNSSALGTNSTSLTSGTVLVNGGIGISGNASIGQSLNFFGNTDSRYFVAFRAPSGLASTTLYTLPSAYPGVSGYVLASDTSGNLSWAVSSGSGGGNTAQNVVINFSNGATIVNHPILFTPAQSSSSGAAVSADASLSFNSSTNILSVSGLAITSGTNSTTISTGALIVQGGLAVTGQINAASVVIAGNAVVNGNLQFKGVGTFGDATTDTITSLARYASDLLPSVDNTYDLGNVALGWRHFKVTGIGTLGTVYVTDTTQTTSTTTGALIVSGGAGIAGTIRAGGTLSSIGASIFGILYTNNIQIGQGGNNINFLDQAGNTLGNFNTSNGWFRSAQTTQSISTTTGALVSSGGLGIAGNAFIGNTTTITNTTNSTTATSGSLVAYGGAGIAQSLSVGGRIQIFNGANYTAIRSSASGNTVYVLPATTPATGTSILQSDVVGNLSWVAAATGSGSPAGNNTELQFNNSGTYGGATGITYQSTTYLVSIASTADQRAVTTVGLRLVNNATVSVAGVQQRFSPALEIAGKTITTPNIENFNRFVTDVVGTINSYGAQQQWKYSLDTGTPSYSNPIFVIHSQKGVGIGRSSITFQSFFLANASQTTELTYILPVAYPGTGTSFLSSDTSGNLSWAASGGGSPDGSNTWIQYNNSGAFGATSQFTWVPGIGLSIGLSTASGSTSGGSLTVAGSTGIGGSLIVAGQAQFGGTLDYVSPNTIAFFTGNVNSYSQVLNHNHNPGASASSDFIVSNDASTDTATYGDFGINSSGWAATTSPFNTANATYLISANSDLVLGTVTANPIRFGVGSGVTDLIHITGSGIAVSVNSNLDVRSGRSLRLFNVGNSAFSAIQAGSVASPYTMILPTALPATGSSIMVSDSTGNMAFAPITGLGISVLASATGITISHQAPFMVYFCAGYTPNNTGADSFVFTAPWSTTDGISSLSYDIRRVQMRVETSSSGTSTIKLEKYAFNVGTGISAFSTSSVGSTANILAQDLNIAGAAIAETFVTSASIGFSTGFGTCVSGDKFRLNFTALNATHANFTISALIDTIS